MLQDIERLLQEILRDYGPTWPTDITDQVFVTIEGSPERYALYCRVMREIDAEGKNGQHVVNQYIGRRVKQLTTGVNRDRCHSPCSSLIKSYEKH